MAAARRRRVGGAADFSARLPLVNEAGGARGASASSGVQGPEA